MREDFLHYIWEFQKFNQQDLRTTTGRSIKILKQGFINPHSGPDFEEAAIVIDGIQFYGKVEIHVHASDWYHHKHHLDDSYDQVILHVVWNPNKGVSRTNGSIIPTLSLGQRVSKAYLEQDAQLQIKNELACATFWHDIPKIIKTSMIERVLVERLLRKAEEIVFLHQLSVPWEEIIYKKILSSFGFKINKQGFGLLPESLPLKIITKHHDNLFQLEALLFGQSGLLKAQPRNEYEKELLHEYLFLSRKYRLNTHQINAGVFKTGGIRPANRPELRIAQLAAVLHQRLNFYALVKNVGSLDVYYKIFSPELSEYWKDHIGFEKDSHLKSTRMSKKSVENILINAIIPLKYALNLSVKDEGLEDSLNILTEIRAEDNRIITIFKKMGLRVKDAADSQSLLELWNSYCLNKKCLKCQIGVRIMNNTE